ncbi:MAG TPA: hypothetical protein VER98_18550 [Terriglobia bacterium]|nr:hypothetical protein [Terriglobia bacterium]
MRGIKRSNEYQRAFGRLYDKTPKAVFAAVAFSYATWAAGSESTSTDETIRRFVHEWLALYENGIVQQKPIPGIYERSPLEVK